MPPWNIDHAHLALILGVSLSLLYIWLLFLPARSECAVRSFPRSVWPARVLVVVCMIWFAFNLNLVDLGGFNKYKPVLFGLVPVGIFLILRYIPDLLAVRGLCSLFLLAAQPMIVAARWHGTLASWMLLIFLYLGILKCMVMVIYPHFWLRGLNWLGERPGRRTASFSGGLAVGLLLVISGVMAL